MLKARRRFAVALALMPGFWLATPVWAQPEGPSPMAPAAELPYTASAEEADAESPEAPLGQDQPLPTLIETGLASWYHPSFSGRRMANGQPYRPTGFTAAHKTLPLDSFARVKNLATGVEVVVRITDRGPHLPDRVVDVSQAAARLLGLIGLGITLVEVHSAEEDDWLAFVARQPLPAPAPVQNRAPVQNTKRR